MGPTQLAGVLSIVARASAEAAGRPFDEAADAERRATVEAQIEAEQVALESSSRGYDDGIIDPRDTRTVLGIALSVCHGNEVRGAPGYGVYRM
jgi:acetyl-CoA carboxylase carboxyltransferase component